MAVPHEQVAHEERGENALFDDLVDRFVVPAVRSDGPRPRDPGTRARLDALLEEVRQGPSRVAKGTEARMIPSVSPKDRHVRFGS